MIIVKFMQECKKKNMFYLSYQYLCIYLIINSRNLINVGVSDFCTITFAFSSEDFKRDVCSISLGSYPLS